MSNNLLSKALGKTFSSSNFTEDRHAHWTEHTKRRSQQQYIGRQRRGTKNCLSGSSKSMHDTVNVIIGISLHSGLPSMTVPKT